MGSAGLGRGCLTVDLGAIQQNFRCLQQLAGGSEVAGVVKADAYGLGAAAVAKALWGSGCRRFFVAKVDEAVALRTVVPGATIHVFDGSTPASEQTFLDHDLVPVINSLDQLQRWRHLARDRSVEPGEPGRLPVVIHVDTGMLRLGLTPADAATVANEPDRLDGLEVTAVISHLASADEPENDQAERQLDLYRKVREYLPMGLASLANSSGVHRSSDFCFDLIRPGYALYGGHPQPLLGQPNPMQPVVTLEVPILQLRSADEGETVGYGGSHCLHRRSTIATLGMGYADGFLRSGSRQGSVVCNGQRLPIVGRVSMDLVTVDATDYDGALNETTMVQVIGPDRGIDAVAADAGTIGYEILTSLGNRYHRRYLGEPD